MPCRIYLRQDQAISLRQIYSSDKVRIFAPLWIKEALKIVGGYLKGVKFELYQSTWVEGTIDPEKPLETLTITEDFNHQSLSLLQKIARNESYNVTGIINTSMYADIEDDRLLFSLRDLARQCTIVGVDQCSQFGGYGCQKGQQRQQRVYICDIAALQFQQNYNTGRLVLLQKSEEQKGILDDFIFENVVGEKKMSYEDVIILCNQSGPGSEAVKLRYWRHQGFRNNGCFIDTTAYTKFVISDVILCGKALCTMVKQWYPEDQIHFKFLKYGTGFYAGKFSGPLEKLILPAVLDGVDALLQIEGVQDIIKCVELPFYNCDNESNQKIHLLKAKYNTEVLFSTNDALKESHVQGLLVATTNCGDCHAPCGEKL